MPPDQRIYSVATLIVALALAACAGWPREPFTRSEQAVAEIPGMPGVRFWADAPPAEIARAFGDGVMHAALHGPGGCRYLALSGGAAGGAFGAGVLNGWTRSGRRPEFTVVTGVSIGAIIAPFAFLGSRYDAYLTQAFTSGVAEGLDLGEGIEIFDLLGRHKARRELLYQLVSAFVDQPLLKQIAAEHARGRFLFVVTTNLDAQRPVVWNMGAIASSRHPGALELFRAVITASASIPAAIAPTRIEVEAHGRRFEELHTDGAVTSEFYTLPEWVLASDGEPPGKAPHRLFIIINNGLTPDFEVTEDSSSAVARRSVTTLLKAFRNETLITTLKFARDKNVDFNLTYIDPNFPLVKAELTTQYMRAAYLYGYRKALSRRLWDKTIPLLQSSRS
jgi:predicted acylesterase/phospholipase RssA